MTPTSTTRRILRKDRRFCVARGLQLEVASWLGAANDRTQRRRDRQETVNRLTCRFQGAWRWKRSNDRPETAVRTDAD